MDAYEYYLEENKANLSEGVLDKPERNENRRSKLRGVLGD